MGDSTDGAGFLDALRGDDGFDPTGRRCLVLGAGGAARAVCLAMAEAGAARVRVVARRAEAAEACAALAGPVGLPVGPALLADSIVDSDLIVNASPVGMSSGDGLPFDAGPGPFAGRPVRRRPHLRARDHPLDRRRPSEGVHHGQRAGTPDPPGGPPAGHLDRATGAPRRHGRGGAVGAGPPGPLTAFRSGRLKMAG